MVVGAFSDDVPRVGGVLLRPNDAAALAQGIPDVLGRVCLLFTGTPAACGLLLFAVKDVMDTGAVLVMVKGPPATWS
jgi:hypothetical protein